MNVHKFGFTNVKLRAYGIAFWNRCPATGCPFGWSVVILWWHGVGVFINHPRCCLNLGRVFKRPTPFDKLQ